MHDFQVRINALIEGYGERVQKERGGEVVDVGAGIRDAVAVVWEVVRQLCDVNISVSGALRLVVEAPRPEMLGEEAFSNMEMEMDRFLAKKSAIYHRSVFQLFGEAEQGSFYLYKAVIHLLLRSLYETLRSAKFTKRETYC